MDTRIAPRTLAAATLVATALFQAGATAALVALGRVPSARIDTGDLGRWLDTTPFVDVGFALSRWVALALVAYLLSTTLIYVLARASRVPGLVRTVAPLTLPAVRRATDRVVAGTLVTATLAGGAPVTAAAAAAPAPTPGVTADGEPLPPGLRVPTATADPTEPPAQRAAVPTPRHPPRAPQIASEAPTPEVRPGAAIPTPVPDSQRREPAVARPAPAESPAGDPAGRLQDAPTADPRQATDAWVAGRGDSLWHIAEHVVADHLGVPVGEVADHQVAPYWRRLTSRNRDRLVSGDPDVVAIGEHLLLSPVGDPAAADGGSSPAGATDDAANGQR